jgi:hypothetical protein
MLRAQAEDIEQFLYFKDAPASLRTEAAQIHQYRVSFFEHTV